jgi:hypothetical protein
MNIIVKKLEPMGIVKQIWDVRHCREYRFEPYMEIFEADPSF